MCLHKLFHPLQVAFTLIAPYVVQELKAYMMVLLQDPAGMHMTQEEARRTMAAALHKPESLLSSATLAKHIGLASSNKAFPDLVEIWTVTDGGLQFTKLEKCATYKRMLADARSSISSRGVAASVNVSLGWVGW